MQIILTFEDFKFTVTITNDTLVKRGVEVVERAGVRLRIRFAKRSGSSSHNGITLSRSVSLYMHTNACDPTCYFQ
jgi:hypothetical protein